MRIAAGPSERTRVSRDFRVFQPLRIHAVPGGDGGGVALALCRLSVVGAWWYNATPFQEWVANRPESRSREFKESPMKTCLAALLAAVTLVVQLPAAESYQPESHVTRGIYAHMANWR
jgi:hypothetical protein